MWAYQVFHDAVALVTRSNSRTGFTTRNLAELRTPSLSTTVLLQSYFTDALSLYSQAGLCSELAPFAVMDEHSAGDSANIIGNTPREKRFLESEFQSNQADTADTVPDHVWNPRSKPKSPRKCEPRQLLYEIPVTEMKTRPTENLKWPEILYQQMDRTLFANITERLAS